MNINNTIAILLNDVINIKLYVAIKKLINNVDKTIMSLLLSVDKNEKYFSFLLLYLLVLKKKNPISKNIPIAE